MFVTVINFYSWVCSPAGPRPPHSWGPSMTLRHITIGRVPLNGCSARRRVLYLPAHNNHRRQTTMPPAGIEHAIPASKRLQTHALDRAADRHCNVSLGGSNSPQWARASSFLRFLDHTQRRTTVGRTPLDEWLARRRDLYLTTHNTHKRDTSMPPVGF